MHIPALLQSLDHARALMQAVVPPLRAYEVEHRLSHRMKRQRPRDHPEHNPSRSARLHTWRQGGPSRPRQIAPPGTRDTARRPPGSRWGPGRVRGAQRARGVTARS
ncbi:Scr1 family TA system antitoxin-like transcriptional regulator [Streptomyces sparsogenes]|uniref:Scr1 family TA system antitoxin-like transcriptional regulator n=1 Tax=Streptomyces sparsogenes TaxID=67365 RepID=UPI0033FD08F7